MSKDSLETTVFEDEKGHRVTRVEYVSGAGEGGVIVDRLEPSAKSALNKEIGRFTVLSTEGIPKQAEKDEEERVA